MDGEQEMAAAEPDAQPGEPAEPAEPERKPGVEARLPWEGKAGRADILCWAGITLSGIYYLCILPFRASLVGTHPVALVLLNGSTEGLVAAAAFARIGHGTLLVVMLAAIPGLMKFDALYWWAGRLWGERVLHVMFAKRGRTARYLDWAERGGRWVIWPALVVNPFLPIPNAIIYIIAGWSEMSLITFLLLDLVGNLLWAGMLVGLGYELGHRAVVVAQEISRYSLWITLGIVALVIVGQVRAQRARTRGSRAT